MRTSAPDLRLSSPVHALRSAVGRGLASWPIAEVLAVRWRWCSFPLATFAVCQAARQSRLAARVLAAARTTGTLKMTPRRAPIVLGLDFAGCTKYEKWYFLGFLSLIDQYLIPESTSRRRRKFCRGPRPRRDRCWSRPRWCGCGRGQRGARAATPRCGRRDGAAATSRGLAA